MMMMNVAKVVRGALNGVLIYLGPSIHSVCQLYSTKRSAEKYLQSIDKFVYGGKSYEQASFGKQPRSVLQGVPQA